MIRLSFVLGTGLSSRLVAWYGQGVGGWSHVDAVLASGELLGARADAIGGQPAGVHIRPPNYEKWKRRAIVEIPYEGAAWELWLRKQVGLEYDKGAILSFITGIQDHQAGHWICSACQYGALESVSLLHPCPLPSSQVTPDTLFMLVTAGLGGKIIYTLGE